MSHVGSAITFRPIQPEDEEFLCELYATTREVEMAQVDWTAEQKEAFLGMQFRAQHEYYQEQFPDARFDILEVAGRPIGRLYVHHREDEIRLIDIALLPEHRGAGLGTRLMKELLDEAGEAGKPLRIHVEQFNPALRLYERLGFSKIEEQGLHWLMEWSPETAPKEETSI
jgi:ribosomal protein S18 acetylase RimI-like enzyme